jgi:phosphate starvation-inducible PhoH-like protein
MPKKKNLTTDDVNELKVYEEAIRQTSTNKKIQIDKIPLNIKTLSKHQQQLRETIKEKDITIAIGGPGVGKTYETLVTALNLIKNDERFEKLVLVKSLQVIKGEELGYLKGSLEDKITPYMFSYIANLDKIFGNKMVTQSLLEQDIIQLYPIAYVRGITWDKSVVIIDESQNIDIHTFRTIITRIGKNSKLIFLGDTDQIDRKNKEESCLHKAYELFKDSDIVGTVKFNGDNIRNPIIPKILDKLKDIE